MDNRIKRIEEILKQRGYKPTSARKEIIKLFVDNKDMHLKINDIYDLVKGRISLPTIYRTIGTLRETGIIKETNISNIRFYELRIFSEKCMHIHLKCEKCGRLFDYSNSSSIVNILEEKNKLEKKYDIMVNNISIVFDGVCKECRR
ncbi:MAG: transcriptional repressor [Maledivibacter sp.]|nr:transcriptional repressor [Maledivibacter sp.]